MFHLYLCFIPKNNREVLQIVEYLEKKYPDSFVDGSDPNATWNKTLTRIRQADIFIYIASREALIDNLWQRQLEIAQQAEKPSIALSTLLPTEVIPLLGDQAPISIREGVTPATLAALDQAIASFKPPTRRIGIRSMVGATLLLIAALAVIVIWFLQLHDEQDEGIRPIPIASNTAIIEPVNTATSFPISSTPAATNTLILTASRQPEDTITTSPTLTLISTSTATLPPSLTATHTLTYTPTSTATQSLPTALPTNTPYPTMTPSP